MQRYGKPTQIVFFVLLGMAGGHLLLGDLAGATFLVALATLIAVVNRKEG